MHAQNAGNSLSAAHFSALPAQSHGRYSTTVRLRNEELSFLDEFRYLGYVMTVDCRDDSDIE